MGLITFFGMILSILIFNYYIGADYGKVLREFSTFLFGGVDRIPRGYDNLLIVIQDMGVILMVDMALCILIGVIVVAIKGEGKRVLDWLRIPEVPFWGVFLIILGEELMARWLFLGVFTQIFRGRVAFYLLMISGNTIWALLHLRNYVKADRSWTRVLPQFTGGLFLSYLYLKFGLFLTVIAHFTFDALLFSLGKKEEVDKKDGMAIVVYGIGFLVSFLFFSMKEMTFSQLMPWLAQSSTITPLPGFSFWHYLILFLTVMYGIGFWASLLFFDRGKKENKENNVGLGVKIGELFLRPLILVLIVYLVLWLMGLFISSIPLKILATVIFLMLFLKLHSFSELARLWFMGLIKMYLVICAIMSLGFWAAIGLILLTQILTPPPNAFRK